MEGPEVGNQPLGEARPGRPGSRFVIICLIGGGALLAWLTGSLEKLGSDQASGDGAGLPGIGATISVVSALVALFFGVMADRLRRHWVRMLGYCMVVSAFGLLVMALSSPYPVFLVAAAMVTTSSSVWDLPAKASLALRFPLRRATALSFYGLGSGIGGSTGPLVTAALVGAVVRQGVLAMYAVAALLMALVVFRGLRGIGQWVDAPSPPGDGPEPAPSGKSLLRNGALWRVVLMVWLSGMATKSFLVSLGWSIFASSSSSLAVGFYIFLMLVMGIVGNPVLGYLSDRSGRKPVLFASFVILCGFLLLAAGWGVRGMTPLLVAVTGFFLGGNRPVLTAAGLDVVNNNVFATTLGLLAFLESLAGVVSPVFTGLLLGKWGADAGFYYLAGLFAVAIAVLSTTPLKGGARTSGHHQSA